MTLATNALGATEPTKELAQLLKAAGDELRLDILRILARDSFGVLELCHLFDTKQSGMSHHLKVLANADLVSTRKEGNSIFYRRNPAGNDEPHQQLRNVLFQDIDQIILKPAIRANLQAIYQQRAEASRAFFSENVARFRQQQDLIAAFDVYGNHVTEALNKAALPGNTQALEIGPGAGEFLATLSRKFERVMAIDNSAAMLQECEQRAAEQELNNIELVHNDSSHCRDIPAQVDVAVINMVLHHTPSPQQIFEDVSTALKPGGVMIICDLCQHNQDWVRENCGDLWLGFAPEDLSRWATLHSLKEGQSSFFALRNGFQIQIREFIKATLAAN